MLRTVPVCPDDEAYLFQVYASTRSEEVAAWGWDAAQQDAFLRMQWRAQQVSYQRQYPDADHRVVVHHDQRVGRLIVVRAEQAIRLADIALLPEFRRAGLGTLLVQELQAEAAQAGKTLQLQVMKNNPARRLYERLGFCVAGENGTHYAMEWRAATRGG